MEIEKCRTIYSSLPGCSTVHKDTHLKLIVIIYVTRKLFYHLVISLICRDIIVATIIYIHRASKGKLLGSLLDTEKYINRRKNRGIDAFKTLNANIDNRQFSNTDKMRTFNAYFASVFLYKANGGPSLKTARPSQETASRYTSQTCTH